MVKNNKTICGVKKLISAVALYKITKMQLPQIRQKTVYVFGSVFDILLAFAYF